jgi:diacylglycerol O-acyltransferase 1
MADSDGPPAAHRRPPRPCGGEGDAAAQGFVAALRRRAAAAARASFAADSGDESGTGEPSSPSSSSRRRDPGRDAPSGGSGSGARASRGVGFAAFTFRAAAPVHRKAKESPLSSDAIFSQVRAGATWLPRQLFVGYFSAGGLNFISNHCCVTIYNLVVS